MQVMLLNSNFIQIIMEAKYDNNNQKVNGTSGVVFFPQVDQSVDLRYTQRIGSNVLLRQSVSSSL